MFYELFIGGRVSIIVNEETNPAPRMSPQSSLLYVSPVETLSITFIRLRLYAFHFNYSTTFAISNFHLL